MPRLKSKAKRRAKRRRIGEKRRKKVKKIIKSIGKGTNKVIHSSAFKEIAPMVIGQMAQVAGTAVGGPAAGIAAKSLSSGLVKLALKDRKNIKKHIIDNPEVRGHVKKHLKRSRVLQKAIHKGIEFATKNPKAAKAGLEFIKSQI